MEKSHYQLQINKKDLIPYVHCPRVSPQQSCSELGPQKAEKQPFARIWLQRSTQLQISSFLCLI